MALRWRHNEQDGVSNHQPYHCLLNRLVRRRSKKTSKLRVTGLCARNSPGTGEFPAQMASNAENVSIWWRHHGLSLIPAWVRTSIAQGGMKPYIHFQTSQTVEPLKFRNGWIISSNSPQGMWLLIHVRIKVNPCSTELVSCMKYVNYVQDGPCINEWKPLMRYIN